MKANSERVKNKNIKQFNGKPLYEVILGSLLRVKEIDKILINTDSEIIAHEAPQVNDRVEIHWRPELLQGDMVSMNRLAAHDLEQHLLIYFCRHTAPIH